MIPFLITFFLIYGSLHLYVFLKAKAAFLFDKQTSIYIAIVMIVMIFSPIIVHVLEKAGLELSARLMSYIGYIWMGMIFLFVSVSIIIDLYQLFLYIIRSIFHRDFMPIALSRRSSFLISLLISIVISVYGYFEAKNIHVEIVKIQSPKIPEHLGKLRIVQISDVHVGLIVREQRLRKILTEVRKAEPDMLVSTGDLVDGQIDELSSLVGILNEINPRYGKFAVTGNHEFYAGLNQSISFTEKSGFTLLRGNSLTIGDVINIAGVDDRQGKSYGISTAISERELLMGLPHENFTILLKHRPLVDTDALGLFDLQLSGHVHKGQIFPFSIITGIYYSIQDGFAELQNGSHIYVNRGSGTWGPPVRFLSPPEVTVIELIHGKS